MNYDRPDRPSVRLDRRSLIKAGVSATALGAAGLPWLARRPLAQSGFDWQQFAGEHIEVLHSKSPRGDLMMNYEPEFMELTGIDVGSEQVPEQQQRQKQVIEFTSGATSFDVTDVSWHVQKRLFGKGKWLEDLRPYLADAALTPPDFDFDDFSNAGITYATQADGRIDTLPAFIDYWIVYWNKELFDAKSIAYPTTYEELLAAARALHDPANGVYGWVSRGLKNANTPVWTSLLLGWDMASVTDQGELQTTTEEAIQAAELYTELNAQYAPPGVSGFNWYECQSNFMQGNVAMWFDGIGFAPPLEDPTKSRVVGKVGYGVTPAGPRARHAGMFGTGLGVSAFSDHKGAAYLYSVWATGKENQARLLANGAGSPARASAYQDAAALASLTVPMEWVDALIESGKIGRPGLPVIIPVTEFRDIFGVALTNMINGADPEERAREGDRAVPPGAGEERAGLRIARAPWPPPHGRSPSRRPARRARASAAAWSIAGATFCSSLPALVVILAVIVFPWVFTLWMSACTTGTSAATRSFVGARQLPRPADQRPLPRIDRSHVLLHRARGRAAGAPGHGGGGGLPSGVPGPRLSPRRLHHADDGHARWRSRWSGP